MGDFRDIIAPVYYPAWNDFVTAGVTEQWFSGGRGSAKSSFISLCIVAGVAANPGANAIVFRKRQTDIRDSVYNQVVWAIDQLGLTQHFNFFVSPSKIVLKSTGQTIFFYGLDDPTKRKSIKPPTGYFRYLWLEELDQFAGMAEVRSVRQSVFRGGPVYQSLYSYNPPASSSAWVNAESMRDEPGRKVYRTTYKDIPAEWLGEGFIREAERLMEANETIYRHEYLGEATGTGGEIFANLEARPLDVAELRASDRVRFFHGLDFGFTNDPTALSHVAYDETAKMVYVFDEWCKRSPYVGDLIQAVRERGLETTEIIGDRAADLAIKEMVRAGCRVRPCWKSPNGWRDDGIRWLRTRSRIVIDSHKCPNAWREFSQYEFGRYANGDLRTDYPDGDDHFIDSVRYALEPCITRELRNTGGVMPIAHRRG